MTTVEQLRFGLRRKVALPFDQAVARVRESLKGEGFGVLTEIDVQDTLKQKIGVEREPYVILGACNPVLANEALTADPEVGMLLPCNVVIRTESDGALVEALDPAAAMGIVGNEAVEAVAAKARERLERALAAL